MNEFNWTPIEDIEARVDARQAWQRNVEAQAAANNAAVEGAYRSESQAAVSALGSFARAGGDLAVTIKSRTMTPRGMLGGATPQSKWAANLCYVTENWLCPSLDEIRAYDHMVSICGYNQAGRAIDLSGQKIMPRQNFSYIQTQNANIGGDLGIYKGAIEAAFNNGIRFWNPTFAGSLGSYPDTVIQTNTPIAR